MAEAFPRAWARHAGEHARDRRVLAFVKDSILVTELGEMIPVLNWRTLAERIVALNLAVWVDAFDVPPLPSAGDDPDVEWTVRKDGTPVGLSFRAVGPYGRKRRYHIYSSLSGWGRRVSPKFLVDLRAVHIALGVAKTPSTASGLGIAAMEQGPGRWQGPRTYRLEWGLAKLMRDTLVGGRVDTILPNKAFPELFELDINEAYPTAAAERFPVGPSVLWLGYHEPTFGDDQPFKTGYLYCRIEIRERLTLSPITIPGAPGDPNLNPAEPGVYHAWLWAEEMLHARQYREGTRRPIVVFPLYGYLFERWAERRGRAGMPLPGSPLRRWAQAFHRARIRLAGDGEQVAMVKAASVAGLGRFAMGPEVYTLSSERKSAEDVETVDPYSGAIRYRSVRVTDPATALVHVFSYVMMRVRIMLFDKALPYARAGALVATNYDALYVLRRPRGIGSRRPGAWKLERLQDAIIPYARALRSAEKTRLPGIPYELRGGLTAWSSLGIGGTA